MRIHYRAILSVGLVAALLPNWPSQVAATQTSKAEETQPNTASSQGVETFRSGDGTVKVDRTGKGAVLCTWGILEAARTAERECFRDDDKAVEAELDRSISRIDAFIIHNSVRPVTPAALEAERLRGIQALHASGNICKSDAGKMYEAIRAGGASRLEASTTDLLSIPREPVINPCL